MSHFLFYWKLDEIDASVNYGYLPHAANGQLYSVVPGDTLWFCGCRTQKDLLTIGSLLVHRCGIAAQREAEGYTTVQVELERFKNLDVKRQVTLRREQAVLRCVLLGGKSVGECVLCGKAFPCSLLVAAHIKPRAACTDFERRDYRNNVAPMCLFGCDALFERRLIYIKDGKVRLWRAFFKHDRPNVFDEMENRDVTFCTAKRQKYFHWHAKQDVAASLPTPI